MHDNYYDGIYCRPGSVQRPADGKEADERNDLTYTGGLSEHAIHMWEACDGHGHVIERNQMVNCAPGIGPGPVAEVHDTEIRNNTAFSEHPGNIAGAHDVGIIVERAHDTRVNNNTVYFSSPGA